MSSENSKTSEPYWLLPNFLDKTNLKRSYMYVAPSNPSMHYTWKNIKTYENNKFKILVPKWSEKFE